MNKRFLLKKKNKLQRKQNKEIFRWCFVSCPWLWAGMFSSFVHILQLGKIQVKSWFSILTPCSLYCSWYSSPPPEDEKDQIWFRNCLFRYFVDTKNLNGFSKFWVSFQILRECSSQTSRFFQAPGIFSGICLKFWHFEALIWAETGVTQVIQEKSKTRNTSNV